MFKKLILLAVVLGCATLKAQTTNISLTTSNSFRNLAPINIINWGAVAGDGLSDDAAIARAAAVKGEIIIPQGTFNLNTNTAFNATNDLQFEFGGLLKPASGVVVTILGGVKAGPGQKIFDISAGGSFIFNQSSTIADITPIWAGWWGPDNNNFGSSGDNTKLQAWISSTVTGNAQEKWIGPGTYVVTSPLMVSNKFIIKGFGYPNINSVITANNSIIEVAGAADDVIIEGLNLTGSSLNGTNTFGIKIGLDSDRGIVNRCKFSGKLYGGAIYNSGNALYWNFNNCFATTLDNSVANGGNGLLPAAFVWATNIFNRITFTECKVINCNAGLMLNGGASTNMGDISWIGGGFEGVGNTTLATNVVSISNFGGLELQNVHFENCTNINLVYGTGGKQINITDCLLSCDLAGLIKTTNCLTVDNVGVINVRGGRMSHPLSYFINNLASTKPVYVWGGYFDNGGLTNIPDSEISLKMNGNVIWNWDTNNVSGSTYTPVITSTNNLASISVGTFNYARVGTTVTVSGTVVATPGSATTQVSFNLSLPIASDSASIFGAGAGSSSTLPASDYFPMFVGTSSASSPDVVLCRYYAPNTNGELINLTFTYSVP